MLLLAGVLVLLTGCDAMRTGEFDVGDDQHTVRRAMGEPAAVSVTVNGQTLTMRRRTSDPDVPAPESMTWFYPQNDEKVIFTNGIVDAIVPMSANDQWMLMDMPSSRRRVGDRPEGW